MTKNFFLSFAFLFLGGLALVAMTFILPNKIDRLFTAALYNPPNCPFELGFTPNQVKTDSSLSLKQEAILLKIFFTQAVTDKNGVAICKETDSLNTCLGRFQNLCYQQGKCQTQYNGSGDATINAEIKSYLCSIWNQRHTKLFTPDNWSKVNSFFNKFTNVPIPDWLTTSYSNYIAFKNQATTTTTKLTSSFASSTSTTLTSSSSTNYIVNIDEFRPKAKNYPVLSVSPDIDISKIVPPGYSYAPRIESWLYYTNFRDGTINGSAIPQIPYLILNTNSLRKYKVELIDTDGTFTGITNDSHTKWEIVNSNTVLNINNYLEITSNGEIKTKDKEGIFYISVTYNSSSFLDKIKKLLGHPSPVPNAIFPIIIIDFNKYLSFINKTLANINELSAHLGASKYLQSNYNKIPGLYGINETYNSDPHFGTLGVRTSMNVTGKSFVSAIDYNFRVCDKNGTNFQFGPNIYSLFVDPIVISQDTKFDLLDKGQGFFKQIDYYSPVYRAIGFFDEFIYNPQKEPVIDMSSFYKQLEKAIITLQSSLPFHDDFQEGALQFKVNNTTINRFNTIVPCQNIESYKISNESFHVKGVSLNNSNLQDEISFRLYNNPPNSRQNIRVKCANDAPLILCKNYSECRAYTNCDRKSLAFVYNCKVTKESDNDTECPYYYCAVGAIMTCPENCKHSCEPLNQNDNKLHAYMDVQCTQAVTIERRNNK